MIPQRVRAAVTHFGTAAGAALATLFWLSTRKVDVYALIDQLNTVFADVSTLVTTLSPLLTGAYAIYKANTKQNLVDASADPALKGVVASRELASVIPSEKVVTTVGQLPLAAKVA